MLVSRCTVSPLLQPYFSSMVSIHSYISSPRYKMAPRNHGAIFFMAPGFHGNIEVKVGKTTYCLTPGKVYLSGLGFLPSMIRFRGEVKLLAIMLEPHTIGCFSEPAADLTNKIVCWSDTEASATIINSKLWSNRECDVRLIESFFCEVFHSFLPPASVLKAVESIRQSDGYINIRDLSRQIYMSERNLLRFFLKYVGINPKLFCSTVRFNSFLKDYINEVEQSLDPLLVKHNYYDHSHLAKDFLRFTSMKPTLFKAHDQRLNIEVFQH